MAFTKLYEYLCNEVIFKIFMFLVCVSEFIVLSTFK